MDPPDTSSQPSDTSSKASPEGPCDKEKKKSTSSKFALPRPQKTKMAMENEPFESIYFLLKMGMFHCQFSGV